MFVIENSNLEHLFAALRHKGFTLIAPTIRDGAIILDEIYSVNSLPKGWTDVQGPASYSIDRREDDAVFGFAVGPHSWKKYLYPPRLKLFGAKHNGKGFEIEADGNSVPPKYAFIGVRPCEISALKIHDEVFYQGMYTDCHYSAVREQAFILAVNCTEPKGNCFCASMNTGPRATHAYDLSLTEICSEKEHKFIVEIGSEAGNDIMKDIDHRQASQSEVEQVLDALTAASHQMGKSLDTRDITKLLNDNFENAQWDDVAKRCMACANCTMVCPTCFCSTVEDVTDLTGDHAERWRRWDSCFTSDFTKIAGGNIRMSTRTRYRQWMMHKLGYWHDQFGTSGCVGCGRCITWCPVGIDITREASIIRENSLTTTNV